MSDLTKVIVLFHPLSQWRHVETVGVHRILENTLDVSDAIEQAVKDSFLIVHLYVSAPSILLFKPYFEIQFQDVYDSKDFPGIGLEIYA